MAVVTQVGKEPQSYSSPDHITQHLEVAEFEVQDHFAEDVTLVGAPLLLAAFGANLELEILFAIGKAALMKGVRTF